MITIHPDADGYPDLDALRAALSPRTAAIMVTNPEDTGIYNPRIGEWVRLAHEVGALASYDQANANGILGITRARDAGFDVCHFNLHKTFGTPHGCGGPRFGANAVSEASRAVPARTRRRARRRPLLPGRGPAAVDRLGRTVLRGHPEHRAHLRLDQPPSARTACAPSPRPPCSTTTT